jgi:hypothetical protein
MLNIYFNSGIFAGKDQNIMLSVLFKYKDIANVITQDNNYRYDPWFYMEYLLSGIGYYTLDKIFYNFINNT